MSLPDGRIRVYHPPIELVGGVGQNLVEGMADLIDQGRIAARGSSALVSLLEELDDPALVYNTRLRPLL